jgi:hypothetical protein
MQFGGQSAIRCPHKCLNDGFLPLGGAKGMLLSLPAERSAKGWGLMGG